MQYTGNELDLFAKARNWKRYWSRLIRPYVRGDVLEVGAGLGANIPYLLHDEVRSLTAMEPDPALYERLETARRTLQDARVATRRAALADSCAGPFDTICYVDVLEHIEDDCAELALASSRLEPGGHIVLLAPAHPFLYSSFDGAIRHYRRYTRAGVKRLSPPGCSLRLLRMADSMGFFAALANARWLRQPLPTARQIAVWDHILVRASTVLDPLLGYRLGKSLLAVWRKDS